MNSLEFPIARAESRRARNTNLLSRAQVKMFYNRDQKSFRYNEFLSAEYTV